MIIIHRPNSKTAQLRHRFNYFSFFCPSNFHNLCTDFPSVFHPPRRHAQIGRTDFGNDSSPERQQKEFLIPYCVADKDSRVKSVLCIDVKASG